MHRIKPMIALSTSWISNKYKDGETLLKALQSFDIEAVELEYRISEAVYLQIKGLLQNSDLKVTSVHNFFPIPPILTESKGGGDLYLLSSPDMEERRRAVAWTAKTIEHASELGAKVVVLHCGYVEMDMELDKLYGLFNSNRIYSKEAQAFIAEKLKIRDQIKSIYLDNLLRSLDHLVTVAENQGVILGIENRYHYCELPTFGDFEIIFTRFNGGPVGYWHDTGHAYVNESLTLMPPDSLLKAYSNQLIGIHLHDAFGLDDHLVPGTGRINFQRIKPFLKKETLKVLELKSGTSNSGVSKAIRFTKDELLY